MTVQELLRTLPELSAVDLEKVRQRVQLLRGGVASQTSTADLKGEDWLAEGFCTELKRRGLLAGGRHPRLFPTGWEKKAAGVREFLLKGVPTKISTTEKRTLGALAAFQLIEYFQDAGIKVTPKFLFANIEKVPAALEAAFPGYWQAQLFSFCIRSRSVS